MEITSGSASTAESCEIVAGGPCGYVIFGASGDLSQRKLIPAVFSLVKSKRVPDSFFVSSLPRPFHARFFNAGKIAKTGTGMVFFAAVGTL